ncbi:MAG: DinB family protein [Acidimicrobiales bacterium]
MTVDIATVAGKNNQMPKSDTVPDRLVALLEQFDFAHERLLRRMAGPTFTSGDGSDIDVPSMTDQEYFWEPVGSCWSVRRKCDGPGSGATELLGSGDWGRDTAWPRPWPPPFTTIAWRLSHLSEMLTLRAEYTSGARTLTRESYVISGSAAQALTSYRAGADAWRAALASADDDALGEIGRSAYPYGSDQEDRFIDVVWWVNQELLHHGAEIALLRDLYREQMGK